MFIIKFNHNSIIKSNKTSSYGQSWVIIAICLVNTSYINTISIIITIIVAINSTNVINHIDTVSYVVDNVIDDTAITVLDTIYSLDIDNNLDTLDTIDIYYTRGKLIPIAITILVILI
jgi:hypothetical protein